jgi:putative ABC transport system permease protein
MAVWASNLYLLGSDGPAEQIRGAIVSERFFPLLGDAALGRTFGAADAREKVVVLSHGLWTRRFGAERRVLGRGLRLSGELFTVVGVMGPEFQFPSGQFELWVPMGQAMGGEAASQLENRGLRIFRSLARLGPGVGLAQAQAETTRSRCASRASIGRPTRASASPGRRSTTGSSAACGARCSC